jgi:hypothetical protein
MKSITLQRAIVVRCWRVLGQVAKASKRPELMPVLLRAREQGLTDAADIAEHLLFEPRARRVVAQRLLRIASRYGLLEEGDRGFALTEAGAAALETEQVFVPEHGAWTVWASDDPLLPHSVLRIEPWSEPTAYDEVRGKEREAARGRSFEKLPRWLLDAVGVAATPAASGGASLRIDHLEPEAEVAQLDASLRAVWDVTGRRLRLAGALDGSRVDTALDAPSLSTEEIWKQLLDSEELWPRWDQANAALRVSFEEAATGERESLRRDVVVRRPAVAGFGAFEAMTVQGVVLRARSAPDASRWAEWRLRERVRDYATAERFAAWSAEAVAPFAEFQPSTPSRRALAEAAWQARADRPSPSAWRLVAAEDWGL